jgi:menaquinone-dependent protoporphyrinogen oxidase
MTRVLILYGSRHGGTQGIAERIGEVLTSRGHAVEVGPADRPSRIEDADAVVVGSGVYMGSWLKEPMEFLERHVEALAARPVWLFSSGPLAGSTAEKRSSGDPIEDALGPLDGPGSGGRKKIAAVSEALRPRDHRVFAGVFDPDDPPKTMSERLVRMMPASKGLLPQGDFRDWAAIDAWAEGIAEALEPALVPAR